MSEQSIFIEALERPDLSQRAAYLNEACGGNAQLRQRIERLLHQHQGAGSFLESPACSPGATSNMPSITERPGTIIGPYKLLEQIGEGGFGVVFMAEQSQPIQRKVALKVVKPGMDSKQVLARFDAERQALAMMDHPNIAKVLDAGTTESGRPYFVMELVRGVPLTDYCDHHQLSVRDRLELFVAICQAVQHAHQKGIIHRDIKPTNVLVTQHDGRPVVKVIDFGVAKAIDQKLTEKTLFTGFAQLIGTPLYMSPEQAEMTELDVDTRSDIYSLGVLLYELLTGSTPFDSQRLKAAAFDEMRRIIREEEPPRPSTRISTLAQQAISTVSEKRNSDPRHLSRLFQGELDWIVMKALEKDRNRRYETAGALAADVERYLADEPVQACPPSASYKLRKFARRYRAPLLMTSLVIAALVTGTIVSTWQAFRATRAEQFAKASEQQAQTSEQESAENARRAEAVLNLMVNILHSPDPSRDGRTVTVVELLNRATKGLEKQFADDPRGKAALLQAIAESYAGLGLYQDAVPLLEQVRDLITEIKGKDDPDTIRSMDKLAVAYAYANRLNDAVALAEETLQIRKAKLPPDDPDVLSSMSKLAHVYIEVGQESKAVPLFEEVLKRRTAKLGEDAPETLCTMEDLAHAYPYARKNEALALREKAARLWKAKLGPDANDTLMSMNQLAVAYRHVGRVDDAIAVGKETLQQFTVKLGPDDQWTLSCKENLARAYMKANRLDEAIPLFEKVLQAYRKTLSPGHVDTLWAIDGLADAYQLAGRWADAVPLLEEGVQINKTMRGPAHRETLFSMWRLANSYQHVGRFDEAIPLIEANFNSREERLGPNHPGANPAMTEMVKVYRLAGRPDEGLALLTDRFEQLKAGLGPDAPPTIGARWDLIHAYEKEGRWDDVIALQKDFLDQLKQLRGPAAQETKAALYDLAATCKTIGRFDEAVALHEELLRLNQATLGPDHRETMAATNQLGYALILQGKLAEAAILLSEDLPNVRARFPREKPPLARLHFLALALSLQDKFAEAEPLAREALEIREQTDPDKWVTFSTRSLLGAALLGQKKYAEAEPLLVSGYEGMHGREADIPAEYKQDLRQALERLVQLYEATNQSGEVDEWKQKLAEYDKGEPIRRRPPLVTN